MSPGFFEHCSLVLSEPLSVFQAIFRKYDTDGDGTISRTHLEEILRSYAKRKDKTDWYFRTLQGVLFEPLRGLLKKHPFKSIHLEGPFGICFIQHGVPSWYPGVEAKFVWGLLYYMVLSTICPKKPQVEGWQPEVGAEFSPPMLGTHLQRYNAGCFF